MKTSNILVIELTGTPRERGRIYGESAKPQITEIVEQWRHDLGNYGQNSATAKPIDTDAYLNAFLTETNYLSAIQKWTPNLLEEVKGLAEASGQPFETMLGMQLWDEEWIFGLRRRLHRPTTKCTAFGLPNQHEGISYAGQNMDVGSWVDGKQVLLRVMPHSDKAESVESPETLVFTVAGNIGLNGLNAGGLGITCNTLAQLNCSTQGLPVAFIVRAILEKQTLENAQRFLTAIKHASGQNYILSSPGDMRCFECCGTGVARYVPTEYQGRVFHSNHPLINTDICEPPLTRSKRKNTEARLASICHRLGDISRLYDLDDIKAALAAHDDPDNPVSRNTNNEGSSIGYTAGSSIYEFSDKPRLHLAAGPPCETAFKLFEFKAA